MLVGPVRNDLCCMPPLRIVKSAFLSCQNVPGLILQVLGIGTAPSHTIAHVTKTASSHLTVAQPACTLVNGAIAGPIRLKRHLAFQTIHQSEYQSQHQSNRRVDARPV